jgi:glycosyltransferase involved in cell wall biosynthesis
MIVRNVSPWIVRALRSVEDLIQEAIIVDTGSIDDTISLIRSTVTVPLSIYEIQWKDFGHARTYLFEKACVSKCEWFILLDGDEYYIHTDLISAELDHVPDADLINVLVNNEYRLGLVRNNQKYRWTYPAHEVIIGERYCKNEFLSNIHIRSDSTGCQRDPNRALWYIEVFTNHLQSNPDDTRCLFYLAHTYYELSCVVNNPEYKEKAYALYIKRAESPAGFTDERYISLLNAGRLSGDINLFKKAIKWFPDRYEARYELLSRTGKPDPKPITEKCSVLFVESNMKQMYLDKLKSLSHNTQNKDGCSRCS